MNDNYDIIVLGTGLKQTILAGLFAMQKKKVLLVDRNNFFGGDTASLNLTQLWEKFRPGEKVPPEYGHNRDWNVDLIPKMVLADGALAHLMRDSVVKNYLEWLPNEATYVMQWQKAGYFTKAKAAIFKVPATDTEALSSSLMGIFEKNRCREFYLFCEAVKEEDKQTWKGFDLETISMRQVFKKYGLEDNTVDFIGHSVALFNNDKYLDEPAIKTIKKINVYMNSMGLYGDSPFIYPIYGLSGIAEAFIRLCSVHGGTVKNDCKIGPIKIDENKVTGVEIDGKFIKAPTIICDSSYAKDLNQTQVTGKVIRAICIIDHTIPKTKKSQSVQIILPQKQVNRQSDIYITLISSKHEVCKKGYYIAIVSATIETENPEQELEPAFKLLGPVLEKFVSISELEEIDTKQSIQNLYVTNSYDATSHFESESQNIFDIFKQITGQLPNLSDSEIDKTTQQIANIQLDPIQTSLEKDLRENTWKPDVSLVSDSESEDKKDLTFDPMPKNIKTDFFKDKEVPFMSDYDVIGFDVEHCLAQFMTVNFFKHQIQSLLQFLQELDPVYGDDRLTFDFEKYLPICINCVVWDVKRGNLLKLGQGKRVMHAVHGFTKLTEREIKSHYGCPPLFEAFQYPKSQRMLENED